MASFCQLILALITVILCPVSGIIESMCFSPGFFHIHGPGLTGPRDPGWNRLYATNQGWTHSFFGASLTIGTPDLLQLTTTLNFVQDSNGVTLDGWIHLDFQKKNPYTIHYFMVWAVNERNEVYGEFVRLPNRHQFKCGKTTVDNKETFFFPCSAGPSNSASVPNMYVYAHLRYTGNSQRFGNAEVFDTSRSGRPKHISLLWRTPAQSWCERPSKFRFMIAMSGDKFWEDQWCDDWSVASIPSSVTEMYAATGWGPIITITDWIHPNFYGHPSRYDPLSQKVTLSCGGPLSAKAWVQKLEPGTLGPEWPDLRLWETPIMPGKPPAPPNQPNWEYPAVIQRATCRGVHPDPSKPPLDVEMPFWGRCRSRQSGVLEYLNGNPENQMQCVDAGVPLGQPEFKKDYQSHVVNFTERLKGACECLLISDGAPAQYRMLRTVSEAEAPAPVFLADRCDPTGMSNEQQAMGGICVHTKVGALVYGVRQWHGVTSLCVTLIITPLSIFIARYYKGEMLLVERRVPLKGWYIYHVMLAFPAIWMYGSGLATLSRQKDVLGYSLSEAARFHRILGVAACTLIPFQFLTGFIRPINKCGRWVVIFMHWMGGVAQHFLELVLCIFASRIPAAPTQSHSLYSKEFGTWESSPVSLLIIGWFLFSAVLHIGIMIRIKQEDCRAGVGARAVFPIIVPLLDSEDREDLELGRIERDQWLRKITLLVYAFVSLVVYTVCVVSLYQALYDKLYYGYGPMSCTHSLNGTLINSTDENGACHPQKI